MTTSAKQIAAYRLLNHLQLMQATESPPMLLMEDEIPQNEPIPTPLGGPGVPRARQISTSAARSSRVAWRRMWTYTAHTLSKPHGFRSQNADLRDYVYREQASHQYLPPCIE